jgi:SAM-dependent methyltransferase
METQGVSLNWYRTSFTEAFNAMSWNEDVEEKIGLVLEMVGARGDERVLDLACAIGKHSVELCRRGFTVIGTDPRSDLLEIAGAEAQLHDVWPYFVNEDPRQMAFSSEFDLVLSLGGGAFGHFDYDEEDRRALKAMARALRPRGRLLLQVPNLPYVEAHLPERTWFTTGDTVELVEHHWNAGTRRIDGTAVSVEAAPELEYTEPAPFQRRIYSVEELARLFEQVGLNLLDVFDEQGDRCAATLDQRDLYVLAGSR